MLILFGCVCLSAQGEETAPAPLKVVASFSVLADIAKVLGGDEVQVSSLAKVGESPSTYQTKASDKQVLSSADLVLVNGFGLDDWVEPVFKESGSKAAFFVTTTGMKPELFHGRVDPHAWQSPVNALVYAINISTAMSELRPEHSDTFELRLAFFLEALVEIDTQAIAAFSKLPREERIYMVDHEAFNYLASAYSLTFIPTEREDLDEATKTKQVQELGLNTAYRVAAQGKTHLDAKLKNRGIKHVKELFGDSLSEKDGPASSYLSMMRHNIAMLASPTVSDAASSDMSTSSMATPTPDK